jgi:hypothetical protein
MSIDPDWRPHEDNDNVMNSRPFFLFSIKRSQCPEAACDQMPLADDNVRAVSIRGVIHLLELLLQDRSSARGVCSRQGARSATFIFIERKSKARSHFGANSNAPSDMHAWGGGCYTCGPRGRGKEREAWLPPTGTQFAQVLSCHRNVSASCDAGEHDWRHLWQRSMRSGKGKRLRGQRAATKQNRHKMSPREKSTRRRGSARNDEKKASAGNSCAHACMRKGS